MNCVMTLHDIGAHHSSAYALAPTTLEVSQLAKERVNLREKVNSTEGKDELMSKGGNVLDCQ